MDDERFSHVGRDPKFRSMPRKDKKVKIGKRFEAMFKDNRFKLKYTVDKRGRPVNFSSTEDLKRYYDTNEDSDDDDGGDDELENEEERGEEEVVDNEIVGHNHEDVNDADEDKAGDGVSGDTAEKSVIPKSKKLTGSKDSIKESSKSTRTKLKEKSKTKKVHATGSVDDKGTDDTKADTTKDTKKKKKGKQQQFPACEDEPIAEEVRGKLFDLAVDYARGGGVLVEDSSSDDESEPDEVELEHDWAELDRDAGRIDDTEVTSRLALCNMDWDRIKATDIMVLLHSFLPPGGLIQDVKIYPSEFGKKRLAEEEDRGPSELYEAEAHRDAESSDEDDATPKESSERSQMEYIRKYQLSRLRYYYAIVTCDSAATASKLYDECEGLEFESSASRLDLRFVPDDMTFDETPRDVSTSMPEAGRYRPSRFITTALQQRLVRFTWDETDVDRQEAVRRVLEKGADADDADIRAYLADSSDEEETVGDAAAGSDGDEGPVSEQERIARYRALLTDDGQHGDDADKEGDVEMEISWGGADIKEKTEEVVKRKEQQQNLTPWEKYMDKQKQKKREDKKKAKSAQQNKSANSGSGDDSDIPSDVAGDPFFKEELDARRRDKDKRKKDKKKKQAKENDDNEEEEKDKDQLALLTMDDGEEGNKQHFNFKQIVKEEAATGKKKKWKKKRKPAAEEAKRQQDFQVDVTDARFAKLYESATFNMDPSDERYKHTSAVEMLIKEKQRRIAAGEVTLEEPAPKKARPTESVSAPPESAAPADDMAALVNNIKSRTKHIARKKHTTGKR